MDANKLDSDETAFIKFCHRKMKNKQQVDI